NANRNPWYGQAQIEAILQQALGARAVLWLDEGLAHDHTDGHVDNLVRFVAPGRVVCMSPSGFDDPNAALLRGLPARLRAMTDARGRRLQVTTLPSPGAVVDEAGGPMAASYMNFVIGNRTVVMPTYNAKADHLALQSLRQLFANRRVVGIDAQAILTGGGSFHCMTQPQFR
ncbi:MAG: agmatine deiminase family protein, partial [Deltaproteobacteria bacterium]